MNLPNTDGELVARLRQRDGAAFREVVGRHHGAMIRFAQTFVSSHAVAEEVVQETWLAVVKGIDKFEGRSSFKTWLFRILANQSRARGASEARTIAVSSLGQGDETPDGPSVWPERFAGPAGRGMWAQPPARWSDLPEERVLGAETFAVVADTVATLPEMQRRVIVLRDMEGWSSSEVCDLLGISEGNQRVLLHRARSVLRQRLEEHLGARR